MSLFKLAIVGRPNVGKSTLFNRICKKKISIVHEREGITRDRIYHKAFYNDKPFIAIDTAGIDTSLKLSLIDEINIQTQIAIEEADILVMVVDGRVGLTRYDDEVAKMLLKTDKKVILAVNKIDDETKSSSFEFYGLALKDIIEISCAHNFGIDKLLDLAFNGMDFSKTSENISSNAKIAIF